MGPHTALPIVINCPVVFSWILSWSEISSFSKVILVLGKARSLRALNVGCRGAESPEWLDVSPKNFIGDVIQEWARSREEAANHLLPRAAALNHMNRFHGGMFKLNTKFDAGPLLYSLVLNVMATQYTCSLSGIYHPHCLVQWSRQCSRMRIPVHSPWLPGYIDVTNHSHHVNNGWTFSGQTSYLVYILCT